MRRAVLALTLAVLVAACGSEPEEAEVLGVVLERSPTPSETVEEREPEPPRLPDPATAVYPAADNDVTSGTDVENEEPSHPAPSVQQSEPQPQAEPEPEFALWALPSGEGEGGSVWSVHEDADTGALQWVETSSTQVERVEGAPDRNPLRVSLVRDGGSDSPQRTAVCAGGIHADDEVAVDAHGTIEVSLLVDGKVVQTTRTRVDVVIQPDSGIAAAEATAPVVVALAEVSQVSCGVTFLSD